MNNPWSDLRARVGFELLRRLPSTGRLHAWNKKGLVENRKFACDLFQRVLEQAGEVTTQNGGRIPLDDFASTLKDHSQVRASGRVSRNVAPLEPGSSVMSPL